MDRTVAKKHLEMIGNIVYIITCFDYRSFNRQMETVHATFDGTKEKLKKIADVWASSGYRVEFTGDMVEVRSLDDELLKIYKVQTRKILE